MQLTKRQTKILTSGINFQTIFIDPHNHYQQYKIMKAPGQILMLYFMYQRVGYRFNTWYNHQIV